MYSKQILASGFTVKRFVTQTIFILLVSGIISASMAVFGWDLILLSITCLFAGFALFPTVSIILSRFTQFWVLVVLNILVGLIPFVILKGYCYFQIGSVVCSTHSITVSSLAFWFFPSIALWIPWLFAPLEKTRRKYD